MNNYDRAREKAREEKDRLQWRVAEIRKRLEDNFSKRWFSTEEAARIAAYIGVRLDHLKQSGTPRSTVAFDAFKLPDPSAALGKLRRYAAAPRRAIERRGEDNRRFSRTPGPYLKLVEEIAKRLNADTDDLLVEVFGGTRADPFASGRNGFNEEASRELERMLRDLARRLGDRLDLRSYYRDIAMHGAVRDLRARDVRFLRDSGGDITSPVGNFIDAAMPVIDAMNPEECGFWDLPYVFQGRVPAVPLYRIRVSAPIPVDLRLKSQRGERHGLAAIECRKGRFAYWWELRLGVGPRNNHAESGLLFERVPLALVELEDGAKVGPQDDARRILWPEQAYDLPCDGWPDEEVTFYRGQEIFFGEVLDPETGKRFTDLSPTVERAKQFTVGFDPSAVDYLPVTPETCWRFLVKWPEEYPDRIEYLGLHPSGSEDRPAGGFFPPRTPGESLERQLRSRDRSPESIEGKLLADGEALKTAFRDLQKERRAALEADAVAEDAGTRPIQEKLVNERFDMKALHWRLDLGLSREVAARLLGITTRTLGDFEREARPVPHTVRLAMLYCARERELAEAMASRLDADAASRARGRTPARA